MEKMLRHHMDQPASIAKLRPEVPSEVQQVVAKMLARKPQDRYQEPTQVIEALKVYGR